MKDKVIEKISDLIKRSDAIKHNGREIYTQDIPVAFAWKVEVLNLIETILGKRNHAYYEQCKNSLGKIASNYGFTSSLLATVQLLKSLRNDLNNGFIGSLENSVVAESYDDFLMHAEAYLKKDRYFEAGVIAGVVFEDTVRKSCDVVGVTHNKKNLDTIINGLKSGGHITKNKAARCRAAATVRNSATHANREEFGKNDVSACIEITRELIEQFLEA